MLKRFLLAAVAAAVCSSTAFAQTPFDILEFDNVAGLDVVGLLVSDSEAFVAATGVDDVTFVEDTQIDGIQFSGIFQQSPGGGDGAIADGDLDFTINIFDSSILDGQISAPVASFDILGADLNRVSSPNSNIATTNEIFDFSAPIDFLFTGGETFFVNILHEGEGSTGDFFSIGITQGSGNSFATFDTENFSSLDAQTSAIDFQLTSAAVPAAVPEPSSAALLALGFAGFVARRRR